MSVLSVFVNSKIDHEKLSIQYRWHITELVVDADDHGEGGAEGDDARHGVGPGSLAVLYLHPAVNIVS